MAGSVPPLLVAAALAAVAACRVGELVARRDVISGRVSAGWTLHAFVLLGVLMLAGGLWEWRSRGYTQGWPPFGAGVACAAFSFWLRRAAIAALGPLWSLQIEIREHHQLVRRGPFRWVRHPAYLSLIAEQAAFALIVGAPRTALVVGPLFLLLLATRLIWEERALREKLGPEYAAYARRTPALIPWKLPR